MCECITERWEIYGTRNNEKKELFKAQMGIDKEEGAPFEAAAPPVTMTLTFE